jgi:hypothetical protein
VRGIEFKPQCHQITQKTKPNQKKKPYFKGLVEWLSLAPACLLPSFPKLPFTNFLFSQDHWTDMLEI